MSEAAENLETGPAVAPSPPRHELGHRDRLRERFVAGGPTAVPDYELLELILFRSIPRRDVKPIAKALLRRFGSLAEVLNAPPRLLREVEGIGEATAIDFQIITAVNQRAMRTALLRREVLGSWTAVLDYCKAAMGLETREQFRILFLDNRNALIADEVQQIGTVNHTPAYPREVVHRALQLSATALILVHNHPSGDTTPSRADIEMTRAIVDAGKPMGIAIHDHLIIGRSDHASFRALRLL